MLHPCKCYEAVPEPGKNYELANECVVLLEVRDSLEGTGLLNWSVHTPMTDWQGLTVEGIAAARDEDRSRGIRTFRRTAE